MAKRPRVVYASRNRNRRTLAYCLLALGLVSEIASAECLVRGRAATLEQVFVRTPSGDHFTVDLRGVDVTAKVPKSSFSRTEVYVRGSLSFTGSTRRVGYTFATESRLAGRMISAFRGAGVVHARERGGSVLASLVMRAGDAPPGQVAEPREFIRDVRVPCTALSLDPDGGGDVKGPTGDGTWWAFGRLHTAVTLRAEPRWTAPSITLDGTRVRDGFTLEFERLAAQDGWTQVMRPGENVIVIGWLRSSDIVPFPHRPTDFGCCPTYGGRLRSESADTTTLAYAGPAEIALGTPVFLAAGSEPWAVVGQGGTFGVRLRRGEEWARLTHVPGVLGAPAYVAASAVMFPSGVRPH
jgi:hypothetical protein